MKEPVSLYASIALPIPINRPFTYAIPSDIEGSADFGCRALVPFGRRILTGFIVGLQDTPGDVPLSKVKPIAEIIDDEPVFDSHMYALASWVADYYMSSVGEVLKSAMPFGTMIRSRLRVHAVESADGGDSFLTRRQEEVLGLVRKEGAVLMRTLERASTLPAAHIVRTLEEKGLVRIEREVTSPSVGPKTVRYVRPAPMPPEHPPSRAKARARCIEALKLHPEGIALSELLERYSLSRGVVNAVVKAGWAYYTEVEVQRLTKVLDQESIDVDHPLTEEQRLCFDAYKEEAASEKPRPLLVKGVTGSGKTRLYIEIVRDTIQSGRGAIILVPEIALTPQTTRFFSSVFPGRIAVMHSAMSPGERFDTWRMIHEGVCDVVIGPRSAVFAPLPSPGVIIVDEEHDTSYKQTDTSPRYHARDTAVVRTNLLGIPAVLGSATPSLESRYNAVSGKYRLCTLSKRVHSRPMPEIVSVDMRTERAEGNRSSLSRRLRDELEKRIGRGEKSILLMNRRGFSTGVKCKSCGEVLRCPDCAVALTFHSSKGLALCHICGHKQLILEHCPSCGSNDLQYRGAGTQKIEKELASITSPDSIVRMDSDTTTASDAHFRLLEEFRAGESTILLGTQMVAKGLDFPEVTLVGIVSADSSLYIPDFRAGERTFQLITQVAGRAGRGSTPGTVVLQTDNPDNYAVSAALTHDFDKFAEEELASRRDVGFPPFSRLLLIELSSADREQAQAASEDTAAYISRYAPEETEVLGPVDAPISRIRGRYRMHILLKSPSITRLIPLVRYAVDKFEKGRVRINVDVDPIDLM